MMNQQQQPLPNIQHRNTSTNNTNSNNNSNTPVIIRTPPQPREDEKLFLIRRILEVRDLAIRERNKAESKLQALNRLFIDENQHSHLHHHHSQRSNNFNDDDDASFTSTSTSTSTCTPRNSTSSSSSTTSSSSSSNHESNKNNNNEGDDKKTVEKEKLTNILLINAASLLPPFTAKRRVRFNSPIVSHNFSPSQPGKENYLKDSSPSTSSSLSIAKQKISNNEEEKKEVENNEPDVPNACLDASSTLSPSCIIQDCNTNNNKDLVSPVDVGSNIFCSPDVIVDAVVAVDEEKENHVISSSPLFNKDDNVTDESQQKPENLSLSSPAVLMKNNIMINFSQYSLSNILSTATNNNNKQNKSCVSANNNSNNDDKNPSSLLENSAVELKLTKFKPENTTTEFSKWLRKKENGKIETNDQGRSSFGNVLFRLSTTTNNNNKLPPLPSDSGDPETANASNPAPAFATSSSSLLQVEIVDG